MSSLLSDAETRILLKLYVACRPIQQRNTVCHLHVSLGGIGAKCGNATVKFYPGLCCHVRLQGLVSSDDVVAGDLEAESRPVVPHREGKSNQCVTNRFLLSSTAAFNRRHCCPFSEHDHLSVII